MTWTDEPGHGGAARLGTGQTAILPAPEALDTASQVRELHLLSDPALSELTLEKLLTELLERVQVTMGVDTVAILLYDRETQELVARAAKGVEEEVEQGVRIPIGQGFAGRIAAERVAIFVHDVDHADILNPILREKGIRSLLGVPLIVEGDLIGVMHVGALEPRSFSERDVALLQVAAGRAAPAIERARLASAFEREHHVAGLLQRSLLPSRLPNPVGVTVAGRYLPARDEIGGDWYEVIELPGGHVGVAIGDVVGHGVDAAALMGQIRTALHAYALEGHGPGRTLELVDRFVQTVRHNAMATALYGVFDVTTGILRFACAGHLPPIVIGRGECRVVDVPPAAPLGVVSYSTCPEHEMTLEPGEALLLYTDGLVERRGARIDDGLELLKQAACQATSADEACDFAIAELVPEEGLSDDAALLALHSEPSPARLVLRLAAAPHVLHEIRVLLKRWLAEHGATEAVSAEVMLAVTEACANVVEHAYPPGPATFELEAALDDEQILVLVRDTGSWRPARGEHRGRGLTIMRAAMDDVDVRSDENGTTVTMRRRLAPR